MTFNRTAFALNFGKMSVRLLDACQHDHLDAATCRDVRANVKVIERVLLAEPTQTPPTLDFEMIAELLGIFAGAAK